MKPVTIKVPEKSNIEKNYTDDSSISTVLQNNCLERRLASVGLLAAKLTHDLSNPLMTIKTATEVIKILGGTNEELLKVLSKIENASSVMEHQISYVLNYVKRPPLQIEETTVYSILDTAINYMKIPTSVKIMRIGFDAVVFCDKKLMLSVFNNIITNAVQAMGERGRLLIRTKKHGDNIIIEVEDSGSGIPGDVMPRIFEPLFTTKQKGTGLGLASCKSIVEQHGGKILVRNNPTTFSIIIPKTAYLLKSC